MPTKNPQRMILLHLGIFELDGVVSVFYMDKFVTIEKSPDANWGQIQRPFIDFLKSFDPDLIPEGINNSTNC